MDIFRIHFCFTNISIYKNEIDFYEDFPFLYQSAYFNMFMSPCQLSPSQKLLNVHHHHYQLPCSWRIKISLWGFYWAKVKFVKKKYIRRSGFIVQTRRPSKYNNNSTYLTCKLLTPGNYPFISRTIELIKVAKSF